MAIGKPISSYKINMLCSYAYLNQSDAKFVTDFDAIVDNFNFILDSGGFTNYWRKVKAAASGKKVQLIELPAYLNFCKKVMDRVYGYVALDMPRNPKKTKQNLDIMTDAGLRPMPVFAEGLNYEDIPDLIKINAKICVAGAVQSSDKYTVQRYQKVMKASNDQALIHALGFGRMKLIFNVPIRTADSSTWTNSSRYGTCAFFEPSEGILHVPMPKVRKGNISKHWQKTLSYLDRFNVQPEEILDKTNWRVLSRTPSFVAATMAFAYLRFMYYLRELKNVDYFLVLPNLSNSVHFRVLLSTIASADNLERFDYQRYKEVYCYLVDIPYYQWAEIANKILEDFYDRIRSNVGEGEAIFPRTA